MENQLTIGALAARAGVATSTLRYYEELGLITSQRTSGNQRRYERSVLRTVSVIRAAQQVGLTLAEIEHALEALPTDGPPTKSDWARMAKEWRTQLDDRITELVALRDELADCIGCGCLSLTSCALFNPGDRVGTTGTGARYITAGGRPTAP